MKSFFSSLLGATLFVILLFFPGLVFEGAKMGLNLWFFTLVPTLLPFMVFSNILIQSRLIEHLLFLPGLFTRKYLHLSPAFMRSCAAFSSVILPVPKFLPIF